MDWLAQCQDNVTEWDIRCLWRGPTVGQHDEVVMTEHCHEPVLILIYDVWWCQDIKPSTTNKLENQVISALQNHNFKDNQVVPAMYMVKYITTRQPNSSTHTELGTSPQAYVQGLSAKPKRCNTLASMPKGHHNQKTWSRDGLSLTGHCGSENWCKYLICSAIILFP